MIILKETEVEFGNHRRLRHFTDPGLKSNNALIVIVCDSQVYESQKSKSQKWLLAGKTGADPGKSGTSTVP